MKHWRKIIEKRTYFNAKKLMKGRLNGLNKLLIVRLHSNKNIPTQIKEKLVKLKLFKSFNAVLVDITDELIGDLIDLDKFITYGQPSNELIRELIMKRGVVM